MPTAAAQPSTTSSLAGVPCTPKHGITDVRACARPGRTTVVYGDPNMGSWLYRMETAYEPAFRGVYDAVYTPVSESTTLAVISSGPESDTVMFPPVDVCSALPYVSFARMKISVRLPGMGAQLS